MTCVEARAARSVIDISLSSVAEKAASCELLNSPISLVDSPRIAVALSRAIWAGVSDESGDVIAQS